MKLIRTSVSQNHTQITVPGDIKYKRLNYIFLDKHVLYYILK